MNPLEVSFPGLRESEYTLTSPEDFAYNCIAWAAEDADRWWWPDPWNQYYWPDSAPRTHKVESFIAAYSSRGYERCDSSQPEEGFEKIAVFGATDGSPTHAARQLSSGRWTSKLGRGADTEHDLHALEGDQYGRVSVILKRARSSK